MSEKPPFKMNTMTDLEAWRYRSWDTKEPECISWIDSFDEGGIFLDVGSNIGVFTLYCAVTHPDMTVIAVEPEIRNFCRLVSNIELNGLKNVIPLNMGLSDGAGGLWSFKTNDERVGNSGGQLQIGGKNRTLVMSIDDLPFLPQHIKIDVDGIEKDILLGMEVIKDLKSVLVEVNEDRQWFNEYFGDCGFTTDNRFNTMTPHSRERRKGYPENVVYTRK